MAKGSLRSLYFCLLREKKQKTQEKTHEWDDPTPRKIKKKNDLFFLRLAIEVHKNIKTRHRWWCTCASGICIIARSHVY